MSSAQVSNEIAVLSICRWKTADSSALAPIETSDVLLTGGVDLLHPLLRGSRVDAVEPHGLGQPCLSRPEQADPIRCAVSTAPRADAPSHLSIERKVTDDVATPIWCLGTAFCTTRVSTCMNKPGPAPKIRMSVLTTTSDVCAPNAAQQHQA
jgi:hypothetical protein